jgi:hypothetical protein
MPPTTETVADADERLEQGVRQAVKRMPLLHAKALSGDDKPGTFEAIVSVFGVPDIVRDVVEPGAFAQSIADELPKVVWSHDFMTPPIGVTLEMDELDLAKLKKLAPDGVPEGATGGLYGKGRLLIDQDNGEDVPLARHVWANFNAVGGDGRPGLDEFSWRGAVMVETIEQREGMLPLYHLDKIELVEWGPCLKGANPETALIAAKSLIDTGKITVADARKALGLDPTGADEREKAALALAQLPFAAPDRPWDASAAKNRVHGWAEKPDGGYDSGKLAKAYLWRDGGADASQVTSYRFIVCDLIAGELKYVPRGIFAAANVLQGGRGGTTIGDSGVAELKKSVERLYAQMRKAFDDDSIVVPWADDSKSDGSRPGAATEQRLAVTELLLP